MKLKALTTATVLAVAGASLAAAAPPTGKGKPPTTGSGCKPIISVVLTGKLAADGAAAPFALSVNVTGGNHFAAAYKKATQPLSIQVATTTKINRQGDTNPADLKNGDRVNVRARTCKADLANGTTPSLTASRVTAQSTQA